MKKLLVFFLIFMGTAHLFAQSTSLAQEEEKLLPLLEALRSAENNQEKEAKNLIFKQALAAALEKEGALTYPFSTLTTVGFIDSPDKQMRIVNYNIEQDDLNQKYTCFVVHFDKRKKEQYVTELKDNSFGMPTQPTEILASDEWYGALYYKIIPVKKGSKMIYTVLGWDYYGPSSQVKLIDAIYFTGSNVKLGSPIFKVGNTTQKRVFFEHSKKTSMALNYEEHRNRIIFDHLSPESPNLKNYRSYYVPDMSYDAFELQSSKWVLQEDVIGTNNEADHKKQIIYVTNEKTGKVEPKEVKVKWINPEDPDNPNGSIEHVAVTPESVVDKKEEEKETKVDKKDKRDPSQISFYDEVVKKDKRKKKNKKRD